MLFMQEKGVTMSIEEAYNFGQALGQEHYVLYKPTLDDVSLALTTQGLAFMESSSFTQPGTALIEQTANPNHLFADHEERLFIVTIEPEDVSQATSILEQIKHALGHDPAVEEETRQGVLDCIRAVEYGISSGVPFNGYNLQTLLELAADIPAVASLAGQLPALFK